MYIGNNEADARAASCQVRRVVFDCNYFNWDLSRGQWGNLFVFLFLSIAFFVREIAF